MGDGFLDMLAMPFVQRMLVAGLLASVACGVVGTFVVVRRIVFVSGGISHTAFGGIGLAYLLQDRLGWAGFDPLAGAALFALAAAAVLSSGWVRRRMREDSAIGALWVIGMAVGVLLLSLVDRSAVRVQDPASILFGNVLLIRAVDLWVMGGLVVGILAVVALLYKDLQILVFDEGFARLSGIRVGAMNFLLLVLVALTVVVLIKVVGVVLAIAMLTLPAAIAGLFARGLPVMMLLAVTIGATLTAAGALLSLWLDLPPGAVIVLLLTAGFVVAALGRGILGRSA
ncbi:MAG: metal ABC transporter permease [Myxococcota bacterium]|nr:metal ABC transporter permease [Myxococcota bacterium]